MKRVWLWSILFVLFHTLCVSSEEVSTLLRGAESTGEDLGEEGFELVRKSGKNNKKKKKKKKKDKNKSVTTSETHEFVRDGLIHRCDFVYHTNTKMGCTNTAEISNRVFRSAKYKKQWKQICSLKCFIDGCDSYIFKDETCKFYVCDPSQDKIVTYRKGQTFVEFNKTDSCFTGDTRSPTFRPSDSPTTGTPTTSVPTMSPTLTPTEGPTRRPSMSPTGGPTISPVTSIPTDTPTPQPTNSTQTPTSHPTNSTQTPSSSPITINPTSTPTSRPITTNPTSTPTSRPITTNPTSTPTSSPLRSTQSPTTTATPSTSPSMGPTTASPSQTPTSQTTIPTQPPTPQTTIKCKKIEKRKACNDQRPYCEWNTNKSKCEKGPEPTASPTLSPSVSPTPRPTYHPDVEDSLANLPPLWDIMELVEPNRELCEVVLYNSPFRRMDIIERVTGLEACVKHCMYDDHCHASMYDTKSNKCIKGGNVYLIDDERFIDEYWIQHDWIVYKRVDKTAQTTLNGFNIMGGPCSQLCPKQCKKDPECGWNQGRFPVNDKRQGCGQNPDVSSHCGRIKCKAHN